MKKPINEIKKMQRLAGLITESEYQESIVNEELKAEDVKIGGFYTASMPTSNDGDERIDVKVRVIAQDKNDAESFTVEALEDKDYVNPVSKQQNRYKKGDQYNTQAKYLK